MVQVSEDRELLLSAGATLLAGELLLALEANQ